MKRVIFIISLVMLGICTVQAYSVKGVVIDETSQPLPKATVRVLNANDSTAVKAVLTTDDGKFSLNDIKKGTYLLESSYVGYASTYHKIDVRKNLNVGKISMAENATTLKDVTVVGIKTPIKVMQDTVEFNADTYKTQPNAVVEDLLKRLPGVEVDSDGKITHNGKEIKKILVDGKEFFSDDPKVASKNLPVDMINKLQVIDRKSDLARLTGVDDGEEETVINLSVKEDRRNGWFGNVVAGYGTDDRYSGNFNVNRFWKGNQVTVLGGANNVNNMGFSDGGGRFRRFGFGGGGITESQTIGVNFNVGKEEILRVGGNVMFSHSKTNSQSSIARQYLFADSTSFYDSNSASINSYKNLRADFRMEWKPDSFNILEVRPNVALNYSDSESQSESNTWAGIGNTGERGRKVNNSINRNNSKGHSFDLGTRIIYTHNFKRHRGRSFSLMANYSTSNQREKPNSYSWNQFYLFNDSIDLYDQSANNHTWNNNFTARASWTEPLGDVSKGNFLTFAYRFTARWNNSDKMTYDHPVEWPEGWEGTPVISDELVWNEELSNQFRNTYINHDIRLGYKHVSRAHTLDVGASLVPQMSKSTDLINDAKSIPKRTVLNYAPYTRYRWKMGNTRSMRVDYNGRSSQPSMTQLQPVADMSDPLNIVQGNPDLDPSFSHNLRVSYNDFNPEAQRALMAMLFANLTQNSIVSKTTTNHETGGRFTTYENVNGVWNIGAFNMISFPFRNKSFTFNNHIGINYNHSVGFTNGQKYNSSNFRIDESFGIAFRPDNLEIELRPQYRMSNAVNSVQRDQNRTTHSYGGRFNFSYYAPFGLVLNTDLNYTANRGYGEGFNTEELMWNASISYQMLRNRNLTLTVSANDILAQRNNLSRTVNATYIEDAIRNTLTRYVMVSLSYRFNTFGKGNEPSDRNRPRWGGPGRPGGGRMR